jgi:hypothetical protein
MPDTVITALIAGACGIIGAFISANKMAAHLHKEARNCNE